MYLYNNKNWNNEEKNGKLKKKQSMRSKGKQKIAQTDVELPNVDNLKSIDVMKPFG